MCFSFPTVYEQKYELQRNEEGKKKKKYQKRRKICVVLDFGIAAKVAVSR